MRWFLQWRNALMLPTLLGTTLCLTGCQTLGTIQTTETTAQLVTQTCRAWQAIPQATYSAKGDTPDTVQSVRGVNQAVAGNNAARTAWGC